MSARAIAHPVFYSFRDYVRVEKAVLKSVDVTLDVDAVYLAATEVAPEPTRKPRSGDHRRPRKGTARRRSR